eukprot:TRINITY_DN23693_c0_g1_i2.p2 TRINITY_DN23693_c0_g1~~TRINITY_DN23693_c0_g1_i2.p2  ORF type:complete len:153 (-),score=11.79 TRINITY_DN23693_c0_g1_i2:58-474(-)
MQCCQSSYRIKPYSHAPLTKLTHLKAPRRKNRFVVRNDFTVINQRGNVTVGVLLIPNKTELPMITMVDGITDDNIVTIKKTQSQANQFQPMEYSIKETLQENNGSSIVGNIVKEHGEYKFESFSQDSRDSFNYIGQSQ